jgi:hypothetical protein
MEYGGKSKGNRKDNERTKKWTSFLEGVGWTSSTYSLPRSKSAYHKNKQTSKGGTNGSNWSAKALVANQHRLGSYICGKSN